ncbi:unnamed protein product [Schistocephalus solidus]|uniref:UNC80 domain-containing protein n=1 Tax=Schistocephalus solidus TaxID=70667 RepID=A0A183SD34_SCHSO|nr:unnamed protein product [Schistocephalus solidus]
MIRQRLKSTNVDSSERDEKGRYVTKRTESRPQLKFDQAETKLLYTLQWMLLDAATECADNDPNFKRRSLKDRAYLHDLSTLQLFIYLFGPVFEKLRWEDFDTLKLESGLRLWMPILAFRQPYEGSFPVLVKPCADVDISPLCTYAEQFGPVPETFRHLDFESATGVLHLPLTTTEFGSGLAAGTKGETPETLITPVTSFYPTSPSLNIPNAESSDEDQSLDEQVAEFTQTVLKEIMATDTRMASHTDLAVIRCLFTAEWSESGAVWALHYIYRRLVFLRYESLQERLKRTVQSRLFYSRLPYYSHLCNDYTLSQGFEMGILRSLSTPQLTIHPLSCQQSMDAESVSSFQGHRKTPGLC